MDDRDTAEVAVADLTLAQAASLFAESAVHFTETMPGIIHYAAGGISPSSYWELTVAEHVAFMVVLNG